MCPTCYKTKRFLTYEIDVTIINVTYTKEVTPNTISRSLKNSCSTKFLTEILTIKISHQFSDRIPVSSKFYHKRFNFWVEFQIEHTETHVVIKKRLCIARLHILCKLIFLNASLFTFRMMVTA